MIEKLSSQDLNNIMLNSLNTIEETKQKYANIEKDIINKMSIINIENEYLEYILSQSPQYINNHKIIFTDNKIKKFGKYNYYGQTVHPKIIGPCVDLFNSYITNKTLFKNNVTMNINEKNGNINNVSYKNFLMDNKVLGKQHMINYYDTDLLKVEITLDVSTMLGSSVINTIEIDPFLSGSFDINQIKIYKSNNDNNPLIIKSIKNVVQSRLILDKPIKFYKAELDIKLNYKNGNELYPFGLKQLKFLNVPYDTTSSYIVVKFNYDKYIRKIDNKIKIKNAFDIKSTTFFDEDIKIFLDNKEGLLSYEIEPGITGKSKEIARNVKTIYLQIPLKTALTSVELSNIYIK